jgi:predicted membrane channel-forming protein YqfA (hemolysin III family)
MEPSWRKPFGIFVILALIIIMIVLAGTLSPAIATLHWALQAMAYITLGISWIFPLKPLLRWMETGKFRDDI